MEAFKGIPTFWPFKQVFLNIVVDVFGKRISTCIYYLFKKKKNEDRKMETFQRPRTRKNIYLYLFAPQGEGNGTPLQYCCPDNPMDGGAWWAAVHGVAKSQTRLSDFTFTFHFHALEKEMATHSSVLAWRIPWTEKPGRLQSMGSHRVGHD